MRSREFRRSFRPPPGLRNPHVQSILATLGGRDHDTVTSKVIVRCDDVTRLVAAHTPPLDPSSSRGVAILLHGWGAPSRIVIRWTIR